MAKDLNELKAELQARYVGVKLVFGEGNAQAKLMLIGEAPGEHEEAQGRPFVGKAGKNLDAFLQMSRIEREEVYITNAVKLRPSAAGKSGRSVNRPPTSEEIDAFRPFLLEEIRLVSPQIIVTLGNVPLRAVTGEKRTIGECHGRLLQTGSLTLYPMYHPASVIYNRKLGQVYADDVMRLGELVRRDD